MSASILGRFFVLLTLAAAPASAAGQGACEHALAKASAKFVGAAFKSAQRCLALRGAGKLPAASCQLASDSTGDARTDAALAHAESHLHQGLAPCSDTVLGAMGFDVACPAAGATFGRADLQHCIASTHMRAVQALVSVEFPQTTTTCGDGVVDPDEDCDPVATPPGCAAGETCVPPGSADECTCIEAGSTTCGDGTQQPSEACDPSAVPTGCPSGMTCGAAGTATECTCADASGNECQGTCTPACGAGLHCHCRCPSSTCGNGTRETGEQCDPMANPTGCATGMVCGAPGTAQQCTCFTQSGTCGNGMLDPGESCDPALPNTCDPGEVCLSSGAKACTCGAPPSNCGNGLVEWGEQCDPAASPTGCPTGQTCGARGTAQACTCSSGGTATCGNGTVDSTEQCDPAANPSGCATGQTCSGQCTCSGGGPTCGNGTIDNGEQCDPAANPPGCPTGSTCSATCSCGSTGPPPPGCDCCTFTRLSFTTGTPSIGAGGCGTVTDPSGSAVLSLDCGGLYFGGGGVAVPLPATVPDQGTSITKIANCNTTAGTFDITAATDAETGSNRNCTSASANNPEYPSLPGCLFGAPLPIPNATFIGASTCVINRVTTDASGSGTCGDGSTSLNLPLGSDLYLEGDLLDGSAPDRPNVAGIQPCPICDAGTCKGGPNNGKTCTPGSSALGEAYPTSHDCPPPGGNAFIGTLPIPFALTTDPSGTAPQQTKTSTLRNTQNVFCGFCGSAFAPSFQGPPAKACSGDSECTTAPFIRCKQRTSGAFGHGEATGITEKGAPAGLCVGDGAAHASTLVSVFCIPPAFNATVDANADLPGPGAVALPGQATLQP